MRIPRNAWMACVFLATVACSYDGIRMAERNRCSAMPQSESERCFSKTRMTKTEYDTERRKAGASKAASVEDEQPADPRYKEWIP